MSNGSASRLALYCVSMYFATHDTRTPTEWPSLPSSLFAQSIVASHESNDASHESRSGRPIYSAASSCARMRSESPASMMLRHPTRKYLPHAVPKSMLLPV